MTMTGGETAGKGPRTSMGMRRVRYPIVRPVGCTLAGKDPLQDESVGEDLLVYLRKDERQGTSAAPANGAAMFRAVLPFLEDMQSVGSSGAHSNRYVASPSHATNSAKP